MDRWLQVYCFCIVRHFNSLHQTHGQRVEVPKNIRKKQEYIPPLAVGTPPVWTAGPLRMNTRSSQPRIISCLTRKTSDLDHITRLLLCLLHSVLWINAWVRRGPYPCTVNHPNAKGCYTSTSPTQSLITQDPLPLWSQCSNSPLFPPCSAPRVYTLPNCGRCRNVDMRNSLSYALHRKFSDSSRVIPSTISP